jgi:predicted nucleic acid-binding protein
MIVHLDTSVLIEALATANPDLLRPPAVRGDKLAISTLVLYEWLRRPRSAEQLEILEALFPIDRVVTFGRLEAHVAGKLYQRVRRPRQREVDIAIAACAIEHEAALWTLNPDDFEDIPDLRLYTG